MLQAEKFVSVYNRNSGKVGYVIPDLNNLDRQFEPYETKRLPVDELMRLSYLPGGMEILKDHLIIMDDETRESLIGNVEVEYFLKKEDIEKLLKEGDLALFQDFLNFAPEGAIDIAKDLAVKMELPDMSKRTLLQQRTGLNISKAIEIERDNKAEVVGEQPEQGAAERVSNDGRRTATDAYDKLMKK